MFQDEPDSQYDNDQAYAEVLTSIKELQKEQNNWSDTSRLCSSVLISEFTDAAEIPDDMKALFSKQEVLCKEVSDHLAKVQRQRQIRQFGMSFEATRRSNRSKYEEANMKYESLQLQIPSK